MPYINTEVEVDLDIDDLYYNCSEREKKELAELLAEGGYCKISNSNEKKQTIYELEWQWMLEKIIVNKHRISIDDENAILKIYNKL